MKDPLTLVTIIRLIAMLIGTTFWIAISAILLGMAIVALIWGLVTMPFIVLFGGADANRISAAFSRPLEWAFGGITQLWTEMFNAVWNT